MLSRGIPNPLLALMKAKKAAGSSGAEATNNCLSSICHHNRARQLEAGTGNCRAKRSTSETARPKLGLHQRGYPTRMVSLPRLGVVVAAVVGGSKIKFIKERNRASPNSLLREVVACSATIR